MNKISLFRLASHISSVLIIAGLSSCLAKGLRPLHGLNSSIFRSSSSYREPALSINFLVNIVNHNGKDKIELINLRSRRSVPLPGINRVDSQPISVSISADGRRVAFIRQRGDQTELMLYRRGLGTMQKIEINPKGIPRRVSLNGVGDTLAVQISRNGRWDIDLIKLSI